MGDNETVGERIVSLLSAWRVGDEAARAQLVPLVFGELRRQARHYRRMARSGDTMRTTALVHEVYPRLARIREVDWQGRRHFFALSAQLMRRILVDTARARVRMKRDGRAQQIFAPLDWNEIDVADQQDPERTLLLDDTLKRLAAMDARRARS